MTTIVNIHEAKTNLSKLIAGLEAHGGVVTICRYGKPIVNLVLKEKSQKKNRLRKHPLLSKGKILGDISSPLSEEDWPSSLR